MILIHFVLIRDAYLDANPEYGLKEWSTARSTLSIKYMVQIDLILDETNC